MTTSLYTLSFPYAECLYWAIPAALSLALFSAGQCLAGMAREDPDRACPKTLLSLRLGALILLLAFAAGFGGSLLRFRVLSERYASGDFAKVSGVVESFQSPSGIGLGMESFEVSGVKFSYSDYVLVHGYHDSGRGSVITGNGQMLELGYVDTGGGRIIVEINEIS